MGDYASLSDFVSFLRTANPRFLQEREIGLDVYLSGFWGVAPLALGVVVLTIFLLALFHLLPLRRRSVPLLLATGFLALSLGVCGSYLNCRELPLDLDKKPVPAVLVRGRGTSPTLESQQAALLAVPLYLGGSVFAEGLLGAVFLLLFGGPEGPTRTAEEGASASRKKKRRREKETAATSSAA